ncbi:MAG TPA: hypothetical protein PKM13_07060, partial [Candidatus Bipolaricaulis anaerobius]|nr:hypothetical protein [Candidatus Bipolaricaulis anaerobius]
MIHHLNRPSVPRSLLLASLSALLTLTLSSLASSSPHPPDPARGVPRSHRLIVELDAPPLARDPLAQSLLRRQRGAPARRGVLGKKGTNAMGQDQDDTLIIPITTAQKRVFGSRFQGKVSSILVQAA